MRLVVEAPVAPRTNHLCPAGHRAGTAGPVDLEAVDPQQHLFESTAKGLCRLSRQG